MFHRFFFVDFLPVARVAAQAKGINMFTKHVDCDLPVLMKAQHSVDPLQFFIAQSLAIPSQKRINLGC